MPEYNYYCKKCKNIKIIHSIKIDDIIICPVCLMPGLKKKLSDNNFFILKGKGFYINDYPKK